MKKNIFVSYSFLLLFLLLLNNAAKGQTEFITRWDLAATEFVYPGIGTHYQIDWEKVGDPAINGIITDATNSQAITLPSAGIYRISASNGSGVFSGFQMGGNYNRLLDVEQWGTIEWKQLASAFSACTNMDVTATDTPDLSRITSLSRMFFNCQKLAGNASFANWDTRNIKDMSWMFSGTFLFNQDISNWNTENVTSMRAMFQNAYSFNQPIGSWNTMRVTNMENMFYDAHVFNQPIGSWNTGNVIYMGTMFCNAFAFNQPIGDWNTEAVQIINNMFFNAHSFNQPVDSWNTKSLRTMLNVFKGDSAFNQPIGSWNLQSITNNQMQDLFEGTSLSCENYASTLQGWADNMFTPDEMLLDATGLKYPAVISQFRDKLVNGKSWKITGDIEVNSCPVLPIVFGEISTINNNGQVQVRWKTISETNNEYFLIQGSSDGTNFATLGKTYSTAENGNSLLPIDYLFSIPAGSITVVISFLLLAATVSGSRQSRKRPFMFLVFTPIILMGCIKTRIEIPASHVPVKFVRIVQVDKDQHYSYSKVVKVINN